MNWAIIMKTVLVLGIISSLLGCEKKYENNCIDYLIPEGHHYAENYVENMSSWGSEIEFSFRVDTSMFYSIVNSHSKISGIISNSYLNTLQNSARITWKVVDGKMMIGYLVHLPGEDLQQGYLYKAQCDELIDCRVEDQESHYYLEANGESVMIEKDIPRSKVYKVAQPYFGGDPEAPHDIEITICFN